MLIEALLVLTMFAPRLEEGAEAARLRLPTLRAVAALGSELPTPVPYFSAPTRAVSNWRDEAGIALLPRSLALVARHSQSDPAFVARCVKLNNYWCIKQARWQGELGGDAEGHTAFATAADGADAATLLVRRYYREFSRRSALAIVRRWAPAECGLPAAPVSPVSTGRSPAARAAVSTAPQGIGRTLRARYLARHAPGGAPRRATRAKPSPARTIAAEAPSGLAPRAGFDTNLRVQPWSARARLAGHTGRVPVAAPRLPVPRPVADIATGLNGAAPSALPTRSPTGSGRAFGRGGLVDPSALLASDRLVRESASLPSIAANLPAGSLLDLRVPAPFCGNDETRIRNYAGRIAASVGLKPDDDLKLFDDAGQPTAHMQPVLLAMSSVELGALRASPALVAAAIERLKERFTGIAASAQ